MNDMNEQQLEKALTDMTMWEGEVPPLWKNALSGTKHAESDRVGVIQKIGGWPTWRKIVAVAAVLMIVAGGTNLLMHEMGFSDFGRDIEFNAAMQDMDNQPKQSSPDNLRNFARTYSTYETEFNGRPFLSEGGDKPSRVEGDVNNGEFIGGGWGWSGGGSNTQAGRAAPQETNGSDDGRAVIRKSTIHLKTKDVRAVYLQTMHLINEARGEFIDESSLQGDKESLEGSITLRVAANRLSEVLNELRALADVVAEQAKGDDVTSQMIDLDARLRNEQRVESELLELLESRRDAQLKEVLQLRQEISGVRSTIERLQAQQARLSKMVELASILIIIRHDHTPIEEIEEEDDSSIGSYFMEKISDAWLNGLELLAGTVAFIIQVVIGGLVWWLFFIASIFGIRYLSKQHKAKEAAAITAPVG